MHKNTNKELAIALYKSTHGLKGDDLHGVVKNFAEMLVSGGKVKQANAIIAEFVKYSKKQEGIVELSVTSAKGLTTIALEEIKKVFSAKGGSASGGGNKVEAKEYVDASILGGMIVKTEDKIFDASLRTQLVRLKQSLQ